MIAVIPARGGSRRVPRKNIREFRGKPILLYSIETAERSGLFERIVVSTDDHEIWEVAHSAGAEVIVRPPEFAEDAIGTQEVMRQALEAMNVDRGEACVVYATVPMLEPQDLVRGYQMLKKRVARYAFAVGTEPLRDAGMFYFGLAKSFLDRHPLISEESVMVPIPENRICDINTPEDWYVAETMFDRLRSA